MQAVLTQMRTPRPTQGCRADDDDDDDDDSHKYTMQRELRPTH